MVIKSILSQIVPVVHDERFDDDSDVPNLYQFDNDGSDNSAAART